jgi:hypothetical protein
VQEKARQLTINDVIGCCVSNGYFSESKAAAFFGTVGAGVLDSAGRNVDPHLMNQVGLSAVRAYTHTHARAHTHTHTHAHPPTHTHTHTHTTSHTHARCACPHSQNRSNQQR